MKENTVTISLKKYHRLIDAEKLAKEKMHEQLCLKLEKEKKYTFVIDWRFFTPEKVVLTDDEALNLVIEKKKAELDKSIADFEFEKNKLSRQFKKIDSLKWYHLLFGIKDIK